MTIFLSLLIIAFALATAAALARGLLAFLRDGDRIRRGGRSDEDTFGMTQNRMMIMRVLFQGVALLLVVLIGLAAGAADN